MENLLNETMEVLGKEEVNNRSKLSSLPNSIINWIGEHTNQLIVIIDGKGYIVFGTKKIYSLLNYSPGSLLGENVKNIVSFEDLVAIRELLDKRRKECIQYNLNVYSKEGNSLLFNCIVKPLKNQGQTFYVCNLENITKDEQFEEMIIRSEKLSIAGQVAAGIAHEIRNPLTSLKGFIQLLQAGVSEKDTYYKILLDEINKIEAITSELLYISKPLTYHKTKESLNQLIEEVIVLLEPHAKLHEISLQWNKGKDYIITCNSTQIKQALINLIKNAIEASDKYDQVTVQIFEKKTHVAIDVIDQGKGIPKEYLHKLSEPFFTTKEDGTGLGLLITNNLLKYHNAKLKIIENDDQGSTFRILMPI